MTITDATRLAVLIDSDNTTASLTTEPPASGMPPTPALRGADSRPSLPAAAMPWPAPAATNLLLLPIRPQVQALLRQRLSAGNDTVPSIDALHARPALDGAHATSSRYRFARLTMSCLGAACPREVSLRARSGTGAAVPRCLRERQTDRSG